MLNRRFFLKSCGLTTATYFLSPWQWSNLRAAPKAADRNFIFCYFSGGWDTLLSLDPRDPGAFPDSKIRETKIQLHWDALRTTFSDGQPLERQLVQPSGSQIAFGPAASPIARHFDKLSVLRGISMDTVTHEVGRRYFITGMPPLGLLPKGSSVATRIVAQQGDHAPIPNLVARVESYNQGLPSYSTGLKVTSITDLLSTLREGPEAPEKEIRKLIEEYRENSLTCDPVRLDADGMMSLIRSAQKKSRILVDSEISKYFDFLNTKDPDMVEIAKRYAITSLTTPEAQAAMAFQALKYQVAQCITLEMANGLDTHFEDWEDEQPDRQYKGFKALAALVDDLSQAPHPKYPGQTLLDTTTILVFSEFGRTALINNRGGRDHSLTSSALLIGAGVPHNTVIGASSDVGMNPLAIDPTTGKSVMSGGVVLTPTLITASLMEGAGYETAELRTNGLPCLMRPA